MKISKVMAIGAGALIFSAGAFAQSAPASAADAPASNAMTVPVISGPLTANPNPYWLDLGPLGKTYVTGAVTGLAFTQSNEAAGDHGARADISNGQVFLQKTDGMIQYFVQVGTYSLPALGTPYLTASKSNDAYYGPVPVAFLKIAPNANFSLQIGKLPTLIGAESTFTFQNTNIERGLLWNQENAVNHGVQANYTKGPVALSVAVNDGFYSNHYSWVWGSLTYTFDPANSLSFVGGANTRRTMYSSAATPLLQNNEQVGNVLYTHTQGPWTLQSSLQYARVPASSKIGTSRSASTFGGAAYATYAFNATFKLAARAEYIRSSGNAFDGAPNLLYGPGSKAWALTLTPTWQWRRLFARAELSYVKALDAAPGAVFATDGTKTSQIRALLEAGILF